MTVASLYTIMHIRHGISGRVAEYGDRVTTVLGLVEAVCGWCLTVYTPLLLILIAHCTMVKKTREWTLMKLRGGIVAT